MQVNDGIDDFVNGLRTAKPKRTPPKAAPLGGMSHLPRPPKTPVNGLTRGRTRAMVVVCSLVSFVCGGCITGTWTDQPPVEKPTTVYVTVPADRKPEPTKSELPAVAKSCVVALENAERVMKQASKLASSTDKALDILSRANQAALVGNTRDMDTAARDLRRHAHELQGDRVAVLADYQVIMDGLATCPRF